MLYFLINMIKVVLWMKKIILFDGDCNFCHSSVQFIMKRDPNVHFNFASLQSKIGQKLITNLGIPQNIDSLLVIDQNKWYSKSSAALHICKHLTGFWKLLYPLIIIPKPIRNLLYQIISKNRYKLNQNQSNCKLPTSDTKNRFL